MINSPDNPTPVRLRRWPWILLIFATAGLLVSSELNARYATGPTAGFVLHDPEWSVRSDNFPEAWQAFALSEVHASLSSERPSPIYALANAARKETGIRFDTRRWDRWLGKRLILSGRDGHWIASTHPGLLARIGLPVLRAVRGWSHEGDAIRTNNYAYMWRDGYLLIGSSPEVFDDCAHEDFKAHGDDQSSLTTTLHGPTTLSATWTFEPGFPISVAIRPSAFDPSSPLPEPLQFAPAPWLELTGTSIETLDGLWSATAQVVPGGEALASDWDRLRSHSPRNATSDLYLFGLIARKSERAPAMNLAIAHALSEMQIETTSTYDTDRGFRITLREIDQQRVIYSGSVSEYAQPEIDESSADAEEERSVSPRIVIDWEAAGVGVTTYLFGEVGAGRLGEMTENELRSDWIPYLDAIRGFGHATLAGTVESEGYHYTGLAFPGAVPPPE